MCWMFLCPGNRGLCGDNEWWRCLWELFLNFFSGQSNRLLFYTQLDEFSSAGLGDACLGVGSRNDKTIPELGKMNTVNIAIIGNHAVYHAARSRLG